MSYLKVLAHLYYDKNLWFPLSLIAGVTFDVLDCVWTGLALWIAFGLTLLYAENH